MYDPQWVFGGILPAWSLCVEVSFYLALPLFAALMGRSAAAGRSARLRSECPAIAGLFTGVAFNAIVHVADGERVTRSSTSPCRRACTGSRRHGARRGERLGEARPGKPAAVRLVERMPGLLLGRGDRASTWSASGSA